MILYFVDLAIYMNANCATMHYDLAFRCACAYHRKITSQFIVGNDDNYGNMEVLYAR